MIDTSNATRELPKMQTKFCEWLDGLGFDVVLNRHLATKTEYAIGLDGMQLLYTFYHRSKKEMETSEITSWDWELVEIHFADDWNDECKRKGRKDLMFQKGYTCKKLFDTVANGLCCPDIIDVCEPSKDKYIIKDFDFEFAQKLTLDADAGFGIKLDIGIRHWGESKIHWLGTFKTPESDREALTEMSELNADFIWAVWRLAEKAPDMFDRYYMERKTK